LGGFKKKGRERRLSHFSPTTPPICKGRLGGVEHYDWCTGVKLPNHQPLTLANWRSQFFSTDKVGVASVKG